MRVLSTLKAWPPVNWLGAAGIVCAVIAGYQAGQTPIPDGAAEYILELYTQPIGLLGVVLLVPWVLVYARSDP